MAFCFVVGTLIESTFEVTGQAGMSISALREIIYDKNKNYFEEIKVDANKLHLWKVDIPGDVENVKLKKLERRSHDINDENTTIQELGGEKLTPFKYFGDIFACSSSKNIRIIAQPPQPATTGKRPLEYSDEGQNSKRAKPLDPNIISTARKIMEDIMKLDEDESSYSNPKKILLLPFPYPGQKKPVDRFAINNDGFFTYMGRKEFRNVLKTINQFRSGTGYMKLFVYGTVGYGKSHILSAIACFLFRTGKRVIFLPDCRQLALDPVDYVKSALFLAYQDNNTKINEINSCEKFDDIINFCKPLNEKLYFIVDQMNALDEQDNTGISLEIKQQIRRDLDRMSNYHYYIMSSSANNKTMLHLMQKQTCELKIKLFGGFDEEEMKEWWSSHNPDLPAMDEQQKKQTEDITGKVPLFLSILLEFSHVNYKGALEYLNQQLTSKIKYPLTSFSDIISESNRWEIHVSLMSSFLTNNFPTLGHGPNDYDHRFFFIEDDKCYYVCGLVRNCMADYLYEKNRMEVFVDVKWIKAFKNNPSVKGFIIEKACLASICRVGITAYQVNFKVDRRQFFASLEEINFSLSEELCTFYLPRKWNQKSIDGLLALYKTDTLYIAPIQITLDKEGHSDSEGAFFSCIWPELKSKIPDDLNTEVIFIWITRKNGVDEEVEMKGRQLRGKDIEINPDYVSVVTGFANVNRDIDRYLSQV
ncbi:hypothetical protein GLOIN_2v1786107 [Rhizophagus irregularis DAOM 181602=DAOM 197198]|uniref:Crinkler effector protein N-terminal domain-containing protein n=4 Tax=Rhizophagus irregularis TaxID=588596 RepID=A0A2P4P8U7_RHIID|nr:hypothetical protein GLOIN_2v1786107 [Rhizophagus irregularis DAOM 181602=DAOM 197198]POG61805.1 hypothetical protein GLOIN_2v1786107 [Rhizophagus irregularis DAOM 181602=DAOM 197198]|eukprot:XP_025168671.1 hypothetical protein GLOIN_2v1786107 [Rhizophagus irregularis DAOM 181602=DAOM 197198]